MEKEIKVVNAEDTRFVWLLITRKAKEVYNSGTFTMFALYDDESESQIHSMEDLNKALENGLEIGVEVGHIENKEEIIPTLNQIEETVMELTLKTLKSQMEDGNHDGRYEIFLSIINNGLKK